MKKPNIKQNPNGKVKHQFQSLQFKRFIIGDLYLFHPTNKYCPSCSSLWGIYDKMKDGIIYLESSTLDLVYFKLWHRLPEEYRYSRRATRRELGDYMYNLGFGDSLLCLPHINKVPIVCSCLRHSFPLNMHNA